MNVNIFDAELGLFNFNILKSDRVNIHQVRGGGVLLAIHQKYYCIRIPTQNICDIDQVFVLVKFKHFNEILVCLYTTKFSY